MLLHRPASLRVHRDRPLTARTTPSRAPRNVVCAFGRGFGAAFGPSNAGVRAAVADKLSNARSWQDVQEIVNRYGDYLSPQELKQLISAAPRMAPRVQDAWGPGASFIPPQAARVAPQRGFLGLPFMGSSRPQPQQPLPGGLQDAAAREEAGYQSLMSQLAKLTRSKLPQTEVLDLADTAHALAHAGVLDEGLATELLQHTIRQASEGKVSVQDLSDILAALGKARFRPSAAIMQQLLFAVDPLNKCSSPKELAALLDGLSRLGYQPDDRFADAVMARMAERQAAQQREEEQARLRRQEAERQAKAADSMARAEALRKAQEQEAAEDEKEREEARYVAGTVSALQRMGHNRQAERLKATYLRELQTRVAARMARREAVRAEEGRLERERLEELHTDQSRLRQQRLDQVKAERERVELQNMTAQQRADRLRAEDVKKEQQRVAQMFTDQGRMRQQRLDQVKAEQDRLMAQAKAEVDRMSKDQKDRERVAADRLLAQQREDAARQQSEAQRRADTQAAVRDAASKARTWQQLRSLLHSVPADYLGVNELCDVLCALPRVLTNMNGMTWVQRADLSDMLDEWKGYFMDRLQEQTQPQLGGTISSSNSGAISTTQLVACLQTLVTLRYLDESVWGILLREARQTLPAFKPSQLAAMLQALATARLRPTDGWLEDFLAQSAKQLTGTSVGDLKDQAVALQQLGVQPPSTWLLAYLEALRAHESELDLEEAAACLRAAAQLDADLVQHWYRQVVQPPQKRGGFPFWPGSGGGGGGSGGSSSRSSGGKKASVFTQLSREMVPEVIPADMPAPSSKPGGFRGPFASADTGLQPQRGRSATATIPEPNPWESPRAALLRTKLRPDTGSIDFDEETGSVGGQQLPDTFLMDRLRPVAWSAKDQAAQAQAAAAQRAQRGRAAVRTGAKEVLSPAQARAMRSVLLERLELAEDAEARAKEAQTVAQARTASAAIQLKSVRDQLSVLQGDYERVRARHQQDKEDASHQVRTDVLKKLLPVLDNFERAAESLRPKTRGEQAVQGAYTEVGAQVAQVIRSAGIEEVPGAGQPFDPAVHDAIMQEYDPSVPDGTVVQVLQKGYRAGGRLIRPALVKVSMS